MNATIHRQLAARKQRITRRIANQPGVTVAGLGEATQLVLAYSFAGGPDVTPHLLSRRLKTGTYRVTASAIRSRSASDVAA